VAETELSMKARRWAKRLILISLVALGFAVTTAPRAEKPSLAPAAQKSGTEVTLMSVYFLDARVGWAVGPVGRS